MVHASLNSTLLLYLESELDRNSDFLLKTLHGLNTFFVILNCVRIKGEVLIDGVNSLPKAPKEEVMEKRRRQNATAITDMQRRNATDEPPWNGQQK